MKTPLLLAALLAATASAQTVPRLEPADTSPIIQAPETDPAHGAIIPAEGITLEERAEDGNDTEAMPSLFRHEFNLPGSADDGDRIHCGGDVRDHTIPDFAPYQGVRCTTRYPVSRELAQPRPADCELYWGFTFILPAQGKAEIRWKCRGDTDFAYSNTLALEDGQSLKGDGWQCQRTGDSITCENADKHGFTIGSKAQKLF
ncbi:DUF6636 domain-containing protein [Cardiobacterium hominis]|uniref:DUF6636 domain-containing protein n=1 Tax=Cardiobacterium hominis TaxID=2718 RepID=UPI0028D8F3EE|nr:DUF6636 domain-containing protein [Cardiobacterium hominis]